MHSHPKPNNFLKSEVKSPFLSLLLLLIFPNLLFAQLPEMEWVKSVGGISLDQGRSISIDAQNQIYTSGRFSTELDFGSFSLTSESQRSGFLFKQATNGEYLWAKDFGGLSDSSIESVHASADGYVYATGYFRGTLTVETNSGNVSLTSSSLDNVFVTKLDSDGNILWIKQLPTSGHAYARHIKTDASGQIYVTGYYMNTMFLDDTEITANGNYDVFLVKMNSDGTTSWGKTMGGSIDDRSFSLSVSPNNYITVTGTYGHTVQFGEFSITSQGGKDIFVTQLNSSGDFLWVESFGGLGDDNAFAVDHDTQSNIFITGSFSNTINFGNQSLSSQGNTDIFIAKLDTNGTPIWAKAYGGMGYDSARSLRVDESNNLFVVGEMEEEVNVEDNLLVSEGFTDAIFLKMDGETGDNLWAMNLGGLSFDRAYDLDVKYGNILVTGDFYEEVDFDPSEENSYILESAGMDDIFVLKLSEGFTATQNISACGVDSEILESEFSNHLDYTWFTFNFETQLYEEIENGSLQLTVHESGLYKVESTDDDGMEYTEIFEVYFMEAPQPNLLEDGMLSCYGADLTLDASLANQEDYGEINYQWSNESGEISGANSPQLDVSEPGIYYVNIQTIVNGEPISSTPFECNWDFEVLVEQDFFEVDLGEDQELCGVDTYVLSIDLPSDLDNDNIEIIWTGPDSEINENSETLEINVSGVYTVQVISGDCVVEDSVQIDFYEIPEWIATEDVLTCNLDGLVLDATPINFSESEVVFKWYLDGEELPEDGAFLSPEDHGFGTYRIEVYSGTNCMADEEINVQEEVLPDAHLSWNQDLEAELRFCPHSEIPEYEIQFSIDWESEIDSETDFHWYVNGEEQSETGLDFTLHYDSEGLHSDAIIFKWSKGDCFEEISAQTQVEIAAYSAPCKISQGISPGNQDGKNDSFDLSFLNERSGIKRIIIYNRYGSVVYKKNNYIDEWHGQDQKGRKLPSFTYYYVIELEREDPVFGKVIKDWIYVNQKH